MNKKNKQKKTQISTNTYYSRILSMTINNYLCKAFNLVMRVAFLLVLQYKIYVA